MKPGKKFGFEIPDNRDWIRIYFVPVFEQTKNKIFFFSRGAVDGHKVVVERLLMEGKWEKTGRKDSWRSSGHLKDPGGTDLMSIVKGYDLPVEFPDKVFKDRQKRVAKPGQCEADMKWKKRPCATGKWSTIEGRCKGFRMMRVTGKGR